MLIILEGERPLLSWNSFYSGNHHTKRTAEKNRVRMVVREAIDPDTARIFDCRVDVFITVYFTHPPQDSDNICDKLYIDALCGWYIVDDDPRYIRWTATRSEIDKARPRVEIEIRRVKE